MILFQIALWMLCGYGTYREGVENGSEESVVWCVTFLIFGPAASLMVGMFHFMDFVQSLRIKIYRKK